MTNTDTPQTQVDKELTYPDLVAGIGRGPPEDEDGRFYASTEDFLARRSSPRPSRCNADDT